MENGLLDDGWWITDGLLAIVDGFIAGLSDITILITDRQPSILPSLHSSISFFNY